MSFDPERDQVLSVYEQTWHDFYQWEQQSARDCLGRFDPDVDSVSSCADADESVLVDSYQPPALEQPSSTQEPETSYIQIFSSEGTASKCVSAPTFQCTTIRAGPAYEACDTILANVFLGKGERLTIPRAVPYSDDPTFDRDEYIGGLAGSTADGLTRSEQRRQLRRLKNTPPPTTEDPNLDAIELETVRRLAASSPTDSVFRQVLSRDTLANLIHHCWQRDIFSLGWAPLTHNGEELHRLADCVLGVAAQHTPLVEHYSWFLNESCFSPACMEVLCVAHPPGRMTSTTKTAASSPIVEEDDSSDPCGEHCRFLHPHSSEEIIWSEDELDALALIVRHCPALSACMLAVVMDKPCAEVHDKRKGLHERNPEIFEEAPVQEDVSVEESKRWLMGPQHTAFGCSHSGPCTEENGCSCTWFHPRASDDDDENFVLEAQYCQKFCSCGPTCARRYPGCNCRTHPRSSSSMCETATCLCVKYQRECEAGVCGNCDPVAGHPRCGNRAFSNAPKSKGHYKIAEAKYGYGLFATSRILAGEPIGEYVAEAISGEWALAYGVQATHTGRNYVYDWSEREKLYLDALEAGNAMRFINHGNGKQANAGASIKWINGELKICIHAVKNIGRNKEILMDYGGNFFQYQESSDEASEGGDGVGEAQREVLSAEEGSEDADYVRQYEEGDTSPED